MCEDLIFTNKYTHQEISLPHLGLWLRNCCYFYLEYLFQLPKIVRALAAFSKLGMMIS